LLCNAFFKSSPKATLLFNDRPLTAVQRSSMKIGDIVYIIAIVFFAWITFGIVRGNFQRKFDEQGRRKDLVDDTEESSTSEK